MGASFKEIVFPQRTTECRRGAAELVLLLMFFLLYWEMQLREPGLKIYQSVKYFYPDPSEIKVVVGKNMPYIMITSNSLSWLLVYKN